MPQIRRLFIKPPEPKTETSAEPVVPVEEKLAVEIMVPEITEKPVEEPVKVIPEPELKEELPTDEKELEKVEEKTEQIAEQPEEKSAEEPPKKTRKRTTKAKTESKEEPKVEEEVKEIVNVTNSLAKNQTLQDAVAAVVTEYTDTEFEEFKERLEKDLLRTSFDEQTDSGTIKMILTNLGRCFDNVTMEYAKRNGYLEQLSNKTYGLIPRQIAMNAVGSNEVSRKMNSVHAPEVYKNADGKTFNLYAVQAGLEREVAYLQIVMKQLEYKRSTLIAYLTANKIEAGLMGD